MTAILRNVEKTFTFEDQRIEINEIALDLYNLQLGTLELTDFSVVKPNPTASGSGDVTYDNTTGEFTYTPPELNFLTDLGDAIQDADFTTAGLMKTDGAGNYSVITDNSTDWNNAASWGDHKLAGYLKGNGTYWDTNINQYETSRLDLIGNVTLTNIQNNEYLKWNGTAWVNTSITIPAAQVQVDWDQTDINHIEYIKNKPTLVVNINDLGDVDTTGITNGKILKSDSTGNWIIADDTNTDTTYNEFTGTTAGLVPASTSAIVTKFLRSDGVWADPADSDTNTTYQLDSSTANTNDVKITLLDNNSNSDSVTITKGNNITFDQVTTSGFRISATGGSGGGGATDFTDLGDTPNSLSANKWIRVNSGGASLEFIDGNLLDLNDFSLTVGAGNTATTDQVVQWNGTNWTNATLDLPTVLSDLTNVSNAIPSDGQVLKWDNPNQLWKPASDLTSSGTGISLTDLSLSKLPASGTPDLDYNDQTGTFEYTPFDTKFTKLSDTPSTLTAGKHLKVNAGGTALEYVDNTFTNLTDTPSSLTANKWLKVNATGDALEYTDAPSGGGGGANVTISDTEPSSPSTGDLWWASDEGQLKIYYDDGVGTPSVQWVDTGGVGGGTAGGGGISNVIEDTTPQLGGKLDCQTHNIDFYSGGSCFGGNSSSYANRLYVHHTVANGGASFIDDASALGLHIMYATSNGKVVVKNRTGSTQLTINDSGVQLGGDLDVQTREINTSTSNGNIKLTPNGTGVVEVKGAGGNDGTLQLNCSANSHGVKIKSPPHSAGASYTLTLPNDDGNPDEILKTDGNGILSWTANSSGGGTNGIVSANVKDFGAVGDNSTDDTTAIQNAINSLLNGSVGDGGVVYLPPGVYRISAPLTFGSTAYSITLKGSSTHFPVGNFGGSVIRVTNTSGINAIEITNSSSIAITNLGIDHTSSSSGIAIKATSTNSRQGITIDQVYILKHSKGIELNGYANSIIRNSEIREQPDNANSTHAILLKKGSDARQDQLRMENVIVEGLVDGSTRHQYSKGLLVEDWTNSLWIKDCCFLRNKYGIYFDQSMGGETADAAAFHRIENCDVDQNDSDGVFIDGGYAIWLQNCYLSSNINSGLVTGENFKGTMWINSPDCRGNNMFGMAFNVNHNKIQINSPHIADNGSAQPAQSAGIQVLDGANDISIMGGFIGGNVFGQHVNSGNQQIGIRFVGSSHNRININGVDVTHNIAGGIEWQLAGQNTSSTGMNFIQNCAGYSTGQTTFP